MKKLLFACVLVACGGTTIDNTQKDSGFDFDAEKNDAGITIDSGVRVPKNHRATATACPTARGSDESQIPDAGGSLGSCAKDSDCTQGTNGRCTWSNGGAHVLSCTYDQCASDSDCSGTVCVCRADATSSDVNACGSSKSNCRVDADCGAGGYCSPSESSDTYCYSADTAYFCHTAADECIDDADCGQDGSCNYDTSAKHWKCGMLCSPPPP